MNVHQLLHLLNRVKNLGPSWSCSCFEFENLNGRFLKLVHGTWHIDTQIIKFHIQFLKCAKHIQRSPEGEVKKFCEKQKKQVKVTQRIAPQCYSVGCYEEIREECENIVRDAFQNSDIELHGHRLMQYCRLLKNGLIYVAEAYPRNLATKSDVVKYNDNNTVKLGLIHCFVKIIAINCECMQPECKCIGLHYAIVKEISTDRVFHAIGQNYRQSTHNFLRQCHLTNNVAAVAVENLAGVCVHINIDNVMYIGLPVNTKELE